MAKMNGIESKINDGAGKPMPSRQSLDTSDVERKSEPGSTRKSMSEEEAVPGASAVTTRDFIADEAMPYDDGCMLEPSCD